MPATVVALARQLVGVASAKVALVAAKDFWGGIARQVGRECTRCASGG